MINISKEDIRILRELGEKYMSYASLPVQQEKRAMWIAHNGLRSPRPPVLIDQMPWNDRDHFAAVLPKKYIMSNKPNPAFLAGTSFNEDLVREDLRHTIRAAKENGVCLEMILKDISTVCHDPKRLWRWAQIAVEEAERA